jgi:hypothetical protein
MRRLLILLTAVCAAGCRKSEDASGAAYCAPDLTGYPMGRFQEPTQPVVPGPPLLVGSGEIRLRMTFAPESNGPTSLTYWLTGDEDLKAELQLGIGSLQTDLAELGAFVVLLLDGRQVAFSVDGGPASDRHLMTTPAAGSVARLNIQLAHGQVPAGAHSGALLIVTKGAFRVADWQFTVLKDSVAFAPREPQGGERTSRAGAPTVDLLDRNVGFLDGKIAPDPSGAFKVKIGVQAVRSDCPQLTRGMVVVALLDGRQIPISDRGIAPHFEVRTDERIVFDTSFVGMPDDGMPHGLAIYLLSDGHYDEVPEGAASPWNQHPLLMGKAFWGL